VSGLGGAGRALATDGAVTTTSAPAALSAEAVRRSDFDDNPRPPCA
jgi:hypothetical protein